MAEAQAAQAPQAAPAPQPAARPVDPVLRIQALIDAESAPATEAPAPQAQEPEYQPSANAQVEGEEQPQEAEQPQAEEQADSESKTEIPLEQVESIELEVTTKGDDGKDVLEKLPVKELKLGYMRQKDYQRKTAEVARQREEVAEKTRQAIEGERTQAMQTIQQLQALVVETVAPELNGTDLNKLATDDPFEYVKRRNRLDQITQTLSRIQAAQQELTTKQKADAEAKHKEAIAKARETLQADIPGWNDTLYQQLMKAGEDFGYKADEVAQWMDPRAIKLLHAAAKARQAVPAKPSPDKKVVVAPKTVKPGASVQQSQAQQSQARAMKQLQQSGRIEDAAAIIASRMR